MRPGYGLKLRAGENLTQQLLTLLEDEAVIIKAPWYHKEQEANTIASLIKHVNAYQRRVTLFELLDLYTKIDLYPKIPINRLTSWLTILFENTLQLTARDLKRLESLTKSLPAELKESIKEGVSRQAKIPGKPRDLRSFTSDILLSDLPDHLANVVGDMHAHGTSEYDLYSEWEDEESEDADIPAFLRRKKVETQPKTFKVERHTRIDFPSDCVLNHRVDLRIQLTKDIPRITRALQQVTLVVDPGTEQITLDVHVTAPAFAIQQSHKPLNLPINGDSEEIAFTLVPLEEGEQVIEIEFFYGSSRVGYVLLKTRVSGRVLAPQPSTVITMEDPITTLYGLVSGGKHSARRTLHVSWTKTEGKVCYCIYSDNPEEFGEWEQASPRAQEEIADYLRNLNVLLSEVVSLANPTEEVWESISLNLQSVCESLFKALIPSQIARYIQKWEQGSSIIISTNEQWIPWELMYDGQCFWGNKFIIARYPRLNDRRNAPDTDRPEGKNIQHIRRVVNVIGGEVTPDEVRRAIQLFSMLPPTMVKLLKEEPVSVLQKALPGADALHCTCHGYLEPHLLRIARDKSRIQNILPETVQKLPLEIGSLVFVNACASTVPVLTFGNFSSFGWEFYRRGAGVFVGTLGAVPTRYAISFAEAVYRELFRKDEAQTIGQAIASAKEAAAKEHNLFWLFYCIYGDPDFTIKSP